MKKRVAGVLIIVVMVCSGISLFWFNREAPESIFFKTCANGDVAMMQSIINKGLDLSAYGEKGMHYAIAKGHKDIVQELLDLGVSPRIRYDRSPLMLAARFRHYDIVELLLRQPEVVHGRDEKGQTSLFYAAAKGDRYVVEKLIFSGVELDGKDKKGRTPLYLAAENGRSSMMALLLEKGALLTVTTVEGRTLLHAVIKEDLYRSDIDKPLGDSRLGIMDYLLKAGLNVNSVDHNGMTPLHMVAQLGSRQGVELLLQAGADPARVTKTGQIALDMAVQNGHDLKALRPR